MHDQTHEHPHSHGHEHAHEHPHDHEHAGKHVHGHSHAHTHDPAEMKKIVNRLSRSIGHLESVKRMVESGQDCPDVLVQLAAVRAELAGAGKAILKQHIEHCIVDAIRDEDEEAITKMNRAIDRFMK